MKKQVKKKAGDDLAVTRALQAEVLSRVSSFSLSWDEYKRAHPEVGNGKPCIMLVFS